MAEPENPKTHPTSNAVKDPHDWTTGDQPMTGGAGQLPQGPSPRRRMRSSPTT